MNQLDDGIRQQIIDALAARKKIQAIKIYREATGCDLRQGKEDLWKSYNSDCMKNHQTSFLRLPIRKSDAQPRCF